MPNCSECNAPFKPKLKIQVTCSKSCTKDRHRRRNRDRSKAKRKIDSNYGKPLKGPFACEWCGKAFYNRNTIPSKCCSIQCAANHKRIGNFSDIPEPKRPANWPSPSLIAILTRQCTVCGIAFTRLPHIRGRVARCSNECDAAHNAEMVRKSKARKKADKYARRAKVRSVQEGPLFVSEEVFDLASWRCEHCGIDTPKDLIGTNHKNEPTVDHIIPLARGGKHSLTNVQCLCRECNVDKRDNICI